MEDDRWQKKASVGNGRRRTWKEGFRWEWKTTDAKRRLSLGTEDSAQEWKPSIGNGRQRMGMEGFHWKWKITDGKRSLPSGRESDEWEKKASYGMGFFAESMTIKVLQEMFAS